MIRFFDIIISAIGLVLSSPLLILLCLIVWLADFGNPVYVQDRVGRNGVSFRIYKIRTMKLETPSLPTHQISEADFSTVGKWLRLVKLDELPQLWNVLYGEMSMVGPRPCLVTQKELIKLRVEHGVFCVRPGITGVAQIEGIDMRTPKALVSLEKGWCDQPTVSKYVLLLAKSVVFLCRRELWQ